MVKGNPFDDRVGQRERLELIAKAAEEYGMLAFFEKPNDVSFLAPIVPELRDYEIVSAFAEPDGRNYDIWKSGKLFKPSLDLNQVLGFLKMGAKTDAEFKQHGAEWLEATLKHHGVKPKRR